MTAPIMSRFDLFFILIDECNEVVDYWIAQRIVNFHTSDQQVIEKTRIYTVADIHKYITFARLCKPVINAEAQEVMISEYKKLRQRESSNKSAWRITVRQLESMIRLSEALARMHLSEEVRVEHVQEAFRLLSKSIIRVEQPDIQFEDNFDAQLNLNKGTENISTQENGEQDTEMQQTCETESSTTASTHVPSNGPPKQTVKLSYDEYKRISNMIVYYIRKKEEEIDQDSETFAGVHKSELIAWYLNEIESQIENEQQLNEQSALIEKIIHRLINYDSVIIKLDKHGYKTHDENDPETLRDESDPILVVHPNYIPDE
jgi:DNA replication licensing factor MCM6